MLRTKQALERLIEDKALLKQRWLRLATLYGVPAAASGTADIYRSAMWRQSPCGAVVAVIARNARRIRDEVQEAVK